MDEDEDVVEQRLARRSWHVGGEGCAALSYHPLVASAHDIYDISFKDGNRAEMNSKTWTWVRCLEGHVLCVCSRRRAEAM